MLWMLLGLSVFLGLHSISIVAPQWRDAQVARLGAGPWKGVYSLLSLAGLLLLIWGYGQARLQALWLWTPPTGLRHLAWLLLLPVFPLALASLLPGRVQTLSKHPLLIATKLWALAHLLVNGGLHDVVMFGAFLAWAVAVRISLKHRAPRPTPQAAATPFNDLAVIVGGLLLYGLFIWRLHVWLIGVSPLG